MAPFPLLFPVLLAAALVLAQQHPNSSSNATSTPPPNITNIVTSVPVTTTSLSRGVAVQITTFVPTTIASTIMDNATATPTTSPPHVTNTTASPTGPVLDTRIDPAFGVLGALLILTGLPSAFLGHKNRWSSFFLTGFYSLALACLALILKYGVLVAVHPPSKVLRGLFVLACGVAGIAGGGISIFFWQQTKYFIGAWGGFATGLWIQCLHNAGLIQPIGFRWILFIGCGAIGFVLCTIPKLHYHVLIAGTAITGASAFMLGVDCFSTAGLKEFYVYNLGFPGLFPKFVRIGFPLSQTMQVELGLIAAVALMGAAVQLRVLEILKRKLAEINQEERKREAAAEAKAVARFEHVKRDMEEWEKEHGKSVVQDRPESGISGVPLMKDMDEASTPGESTVIGVRARTRSGASELGLAGEDVTRPVSRFMQSPGLLPAMNLGLGLNAELPGNLVVPENPLLAQHPDLLKKEELLAEIRTIRKSIDALRSEASSASGDSHPPPLPRARTIGGQRDRAHSMDILSDGVGGSGRDARIADAAAIGRSSSTPLRDDDWDAYLRERKLFQPPAGPSAPIATTPIAPVPQRASALLLVPDAVTDALAQRQRRESALGLGQEEGRLHRRSGGSGPVNILPPRGATAAAKGAEQGETTRTRTFEELVERHQTKLRALQAPLSAKEKEQMELEAAKRRWERSRQAEREAMARRRAEKEAALEKKGKEQQGTARGRHSHSHSRSLSGDRLAAGGGGEGKRMSTAKVQEWQRYQQGMGKGEEGTLPFPNTTRTRRGTRKE